MSDEILARLRSAGVPNDLLEEVKGGYMRNAHFTQSMQEIARAREQLAYAAGQQASGGGQKSQSALEQFFSGLPDTEEARGAKELFMGALNAYKEDQRVEQQAQMQPLISFVGDSARREALDRRLESELRPYFGAGIDAHWPGLREKMMAALSREEVVDPIGFVFRAMPEKAQELFISSRQEQQQQQAASSTEGFANIARTSPPMSGGSPSGARVGSEGAGAPERKPLIPTMAVLGEEFAAIQAQVLAGQGR